MDKFKYKTEKELQDMTAEERDSYATQKREFEQNQTTEKINSAMEALKEKELKELKELNEALNVKFQELSENVKGEKNEKTLAEKVEAFITENHEAIKTAFRKKAGSVEIATEKAVDTVTTANGTLPVALPTNFVAEREGVGNVPLRRATLLDYVRTYSTNQKTLAYVEAVPGEGDFAVVSEGAIKPQLDIDWVTRYALPVKFAGWIKVTEEVIEDIPQMRDLIVNYLRGKHDLFKESQVYTYIDSIATGYVTGGALAGSTTFVNIMDVVNALQAQILGSPNYTDEPDFLGNVVLMNVVDFYRFFAMAKDDIGRPLYDIDIKDGGTFTIQGYTFVATPRVVAGSIFLIDGSKLDVTTYSPYRVEIGWTDKDFIYNLFVLLGESRGHIFAREHDKRAFVKGSIATIMADLDGGTPSV